MKHVERKDLYTSLPKRLHYLQSFIEWGQADIDALRGAQAFVKSLIPTVCEKVYNKILEHDITAQAFHNQSTKGANDLDVDDYIRKESPAIMNRRMFLRWYLTKLNQDPSKPEYWEYLNKVGAMHTGLFRRQPLTVDIIHISMMIGHVQNTLNAAVISAPEIPTDSKVKIVTAFGKLLWIQNDLFSKWFVKDGEEFGESNTKLQYEAAIKGGKADDFVGFGGERTYCPFSGVARTLKNQVDGQPGYAYAVGSGSGARSMRYA
ncbi:uncharacterized protein BDZ99DRAFT_389174 [Mytilinidion resinicola]|uniref:Globin-sensor domain-containing protein n=1 Tax=Mytilinidion resinicola TaxID=574789 RepID=A0A6A6YLT8_9PEZI|nr:uncharacterized protein BDZ99DRAFT_389174 [Mytilinidion resinicola]KAF2808827.1 hypothetical protein BDZ99DRAFT_389174 [Mytilinidion resinicola]